MTPGKRVGPQDTARIRAYLEDTENPRSIGEIADLVGVSKRTIERLRLNFELFDAPYPPPSVKLGRPTILNEEQQGFVLQFFRDHPSAHLRDATAAVWERFDVNLSAKSVSSILLKHRWSRKDQKGNPSPLQRRRAARGSPLETGGQDSSSESTQQAAATAAAAEIPDQQSDVPEAFEDSQSMESPEVPQPVQLPEISLPAFYLQSAISPPSNSSRPMLPLPVDRTPCPTCGCSSREHQTVRGEW